MDSERVLSIMFRGGYRHTDDLRHAHAVVINTCAFIEPAVEESIDTILDAAAENSEAVLVVAGCLPLRFSEELSQSLPEVDVFITPDRMHELPGLIDDILSRKSCLAGCLTLDPPTAPPLERPGPRDRILTTPGYAYLKIAEGCSRRCGFCTIPSIRGPLTSVDPAVLEAEARELAAAGVREIVLVAQDLCGYGLDRREPNALIPLLHRLEHVAGIEWIRLMYLHPAGIPRDLPTAINESEKVLPYLDVPFQHVSEKVLKAMGRPFKGDPARRLVDRLREEIPRLVLRSTFMVGFPAEGDEEFQELADFIDSARIEHVGVFKYVPEEGSPAFHLGDPVPPDVKEARAQDILHRHSLFMEKRNRDRMGRLEPCIVEGVSEETEFLLQGRLWDQAPEVDGTLLITSGSAAPGEIRMVEITDCHQSDLFGELQDRGNGQCLIP